MPFEFPSEKRQLLGKQPQYNSKINEKTSNSLLMLTFQCAGTVHGMHCGPVTGAALVLTVSPRLYYTIPVAHLLLGCSASHLFPSAHAARI